MFADGATLEAIESVCSGAPVSDLLEDLSVLLDNGLLRADRQRGEGQPRFVLFLTVREFAAEQLAAAADAAAVRARFLDWALETVARGDPVLHRDAPDRWPDLQVEARNLQLAAQLLIESGDCEGFTRMAWGMFHWMWRFGHIGALAQVGGTRPRRLRRARERHGPGRRRHAFARLSRGRASWSAMSPARSRRRTTSTSRPSQRRTRPARRCSRTRGPWPCR